MFRDTLNLVNGISSEPISLIDPCPLLDGLKSGELGRASCCPGRLVVEFDPEVCIPPELPELSLPLSLSGHRPRGIMPLKLRERSRAPVLGSDSPGETSRNSSSESDSLSEFSRGL
jgi:hypothetical protein